MKHYIPPAVTIETTSYSSIMETSLPLDDDDSVDPSEALIDERINDDLW